MYLYLKNIWKVLFLQQGTFQNNMYYIIKGFYEIIILFIT